MVFLKLFIIVYIAILTLVLNVHTEEKLNLAVADFDGRNVSAVDALAVSDLLRIGLVNTNLFNIVNRSNMQQLLDEQKFQMTGCTSQDCAVKMGKMLNVQKMIVGSVIKLGEKYYITASAVDVETGRVVSSQKVESNSLEKLAEKAEELAVIMSEDISGKKVEKKIDLDTASMVISNLYKRPCISKILDKKNVMLNRGSADNIKVRELFKILDQKGVETIAKIRVTYTSFDESMAKILKIYKKKPEVGDLIRHYARRKVGGVGLMSGYIAGSLSNYSPAESFYYDYIHASGLGFQLSFGSAGLDVYEYSNINAIFTYDDRYNYAVYERKSIGFKEFFLYIFSVVIKYHYSYDSDISPYFG
ncbi:MAG: CsgG/HfaB family protein, partial [Elusimicrobiota bacterium]